MSCFECLSGILGTSGKQKAELKNAKVLLPQIIKEESSGPILSRTAWHDVVHIEHPDAVDHVEHPDDTLDCNNVSTGFPNLGGAIGSARDPHEIDAPPSSGLNKDVQGLERCKLANVTEQRVLKTGLVELISLLVDPRRDEVAKLHQGQDGGRRMLSHAFLDRLLKGDLELKGCMENDVASAQRDLRYLTVEQLLVIRVPTLDFVTTAGSHAARQNFIETVDKYLFSKLPPALFRSGPALPERLEPLHALGVRLAMVVGASRLLRSGWGSPKGSVAAQLELPSTWALRLVGDDWAGVGSVALVDVVAPSLRLVPGQGVPDLQQAGVEGKLAAVCDKTKGVGGGRMLHWEICVLDPFKHELMNELEGEQVEKVQRQLTDELRAALARHQAPTPSPALLTPRPSRDLPCTGSAVAAAVAAIGAKAAVVVAAGTAARAAELTNGRAAERLVVAGIFQSPLRQNSFAPVGTGKFAACLKELL